MHPLVLVPLSCPPHVAPDVGHPSPCAFLGVPGFNAAVSGCFFALEYVLRGSSAPQQGSPASLTTAMILLSAVLAAVVSQAGLGSDPAVRVPLYEFRSPAGTPQGGGCCKL